MPRSGLALRLPSRLPREVTDTWRCSKGEARLSEKPQVTDVFATRRRYCRRGERGGECTSIPDFGRAQLSHEAYARPREGSGERAPSGATAGARILSDMRQVTSDRFFRGHGQSVAIAYRIACRREARCIEYISYTVPGSQRGDIGWGQRLRLVRLLRSEFALATCSLP